MLDDVVGASHIDGLDAACLQLPRRQADGLVADRTVRYQHRGIDMIGAAARQDFRRIGLNGYPVAAVGRRAEEARRELADPPLTRKAPQLGSGNQGPPSPAGVFKPTLAVRGIRRACRVE